MGTFFHIDDDEKDQEEHSMFMDYDETVGDEYKRRMDDHTTAISYDEDLHKEEE